MAHSQVSFFPKDILELQKEIRKHPPLVARLQNCKDLSEWFAEVGAYAEVVLNGYYYPEKFPELCKQLAKRLWERRIAHIKLAKPKALQGPKIFPSSHTFPQDQEAE